MRLFFCKIKFILGLFFFVCVGVCVMKFLGGCMLFSLLGGWMW